MTLAEAATELQAAAQAHAEAERDFDACYARMEQLQALARQAHERHMAARRQLLRIAEGKAT